MSKEKILKYLQSNALYLHKHFPTLIDARFEQKPIRMVLSFENNIPKDAEEFVKKFDFRTELVVEELDKSLTFIEKENKNLKNWKERFKDCKPEAVFEEVKDTIHPLSKNAKKVSSYEAWKKRHSNLKIGE